MRDPKHLVCQFDMKNGQVSLFVMSSYVYVLLKFPFQRFDMPTESSKSRMNLEICDFGMAPPHSIDTSLAPPLT